MPIATGSLIDVFGTLASMHAALDRVGIGRPCAATARFPNRTIDEVEQAISVIRLRFPVLQRQLIWNGCHPHLVELAEVDNPVDRTGLPFFSFSSSTSGATWRVQLTQDGPDVRFYGVWMHAIADGMSMLAFLQALSCHLRGVGPVGVDHKPWPREYRQPLITWLPRFVLAQLWPYQRVLATAPVGASWFRTSRLVSDQVLARASDTGFAAWLAAAALGSLREQQGWKGGSALLNVPMTRHRAAASGGFGFGIGSLILPIPMENECDTLDLAKYVSSCLRRMVSVRWDENFDRLLGRDPRRHLHFARIEKARPDPMVTVSWKGRQTIGDGSQPHAVACFAVSSAVHISAHADEDGLSISVTACQSSSERQMLLASLAARLECEIVGATQTLE